MEEEMTLEQAEQLLGENFGNMTPVPEEKYNVHTFLTNIATSKDTTKTGFLSDEEVGIAKLPQRTCKELALYCRDVANMEEYAQYFEKKSEILTSTSLSKEGFLTQLAVIMRKESTNLLKASGKENKGWFKKKSKINNLQGGI